MNLFLIVIVSFLGIFYLSKFLMENVFILIESTAFFSSLILALIGTFLILNISLNFAQKAEKNINKDDMVLTLSKTIDLSDKADIHIEKVSFNDNEQSNVYIKDNQTEIFIDYDGFYEIIDVKDDFKIEVYDAIHTYQESVFVTEKELKYYKIYMDKEKINEESKIYLD